MICPNCESMMESCGYGDNKCPECGHMGYAESQEDFDARIGRCQLCTKHYGDDGPCDEGKPVNSPHRRGRGGCGHGDPGEICMNCYLKGS